MATIFTDVGENVVTDYITGDASAPADYFIGWGTGAGTAAKGAGSMRRSEAGGNAFAALGSGAMATLGSPSGMLVTALHQYFRELAKAYGGAAAVLNNLTKTMETGDMAQNIKAGAAPQPTFGFR